MNRFLFLILIGFFSFSCAQRSAVSADWKFDICEHSIGKKLVNKAIFNCELRTDSSLVYCIIAIDDRKSIVYFYDTSDVCQLQGFDVVTEFGTIEMDIETGETKCLSNTWGPSEYHRQIDLTSGNKIDAASDALVILAEQALNLKDPEILDTYEAYSIEYMEPFSPTLVRVTFLPPLFKEKNGLPASDINTSINISHGVWVFINSNKKEVLAVSIEGHNPCSRDDKL